MTTVCGVLIFFKNTFILDYSIFSYFSTLFVGFITTPRYKQVRLMTSSPVSKVAFFFLSSELEWPGYFLEVIKNLFTHCRILMERYQRDLLYSYYLLKGERWISRSWMLSSIGKYFVKVSFGLIGPCHCI